MTEDCGSHLAVSHVRIQQNPGDVPEQANSVVSSRRVGLGYSVEFKTGVAVSGGHSHVEEVQHFVGEPYQLVDHRGYKDLIPPRFFEAGDRLWGHAPTETC